MRYILSISKVIATISKRNR